MTTIPFFDKLTKCVKNKKGWFNMMKFNKLGAELILLSCLLSSTCTINANAQELIRSNNEISYEESYDSIYEIYFYKVCMYYSLNYDYVFELARSVTNNFNYNAGLQTPINNQYAFCLEFVHKLYTNPSYFDVSLKDFQLNDNIKHNSGSIDFERFTESICSEFNVDYRFAMAVSNYETGYQTSPQAVEKNNFGGLRGSGEYMTFPSTEAGIISYVIYFKKLNGDNGIENVEALSGKYVNGDSSKPDKTWSNKVRSIYKEIEVPSPLVLFSLE